MTGQSVSFMRQLDIFNPATFHGACHVIGVGAIGSRVADLLVRIGVPILHLYDADQVESSNIPPGAFFPEAIGEKKTKAIGLQLSDFHSTDIITHSGIGEASPCSLTGIVFICVDSMESRRHIWQKRLKLNPAVNLMIEIRIGPQIGQVYTVNPIDLRHIHCWEEASLYPGGFNLTLACTNRGSAPLSAAVSGIAVNQLMQWHAQQSFANLIVIGLASMTMLHSFRW